MDSELIIQNSQTETLVQQQSEGCWKTIGVWGSEEPRCPALERVIHCRNCDIFTQAGRKLLERDLPEEYKNEWTDVMAAEKEEDLPGTISVVIFRIEEEWLALPTQVLAEIIDPENLRSHSLPHRNNPILIGIINVHGEIQVCVSIRELLDIESVSEEPAPDVFPIKDVGNRYQGADRKILKRMIVVNSEGGQWVFPVNEIYGIHRIHPKTFENVPVTVAKAQSTYTKGIFDWQGKHVALLDHDLLLYSLLKNIQ
ncbi:chemotaxis protein CheW [Desulfobacterales bacterium HSG2]|nr:chemotaxis protein CheW [Desulfobacterales bacterium HSG2]